MVKDPSSLMYAATEKIQDFSSATKCAMEDIHDGGCRPLHRRAQGDT